MSYFVQPQVAGYRCCRWWLDAKNMWNSNGVAPLKSKECRGGQASAPLSPSQVSPHAEGATDESLPECALQHLL